MIMGGRKIICKVDFFYLLRVFFVVSVLLPYKRIFNPSYHRDLYKNDYFIFFSDGELLF